MRIHLAVLSFAVCCSLVLSFPSKEKNEKAKESKTGLFREAAREGYAVKQSGIAGPRGHNSGIKIPTDAILKNLPLPPAAVATPDPLNSVQTNPLPDGSSQAPPPSTVQDNNPTEPTTTPTPSLGNGASTNNNDPSPETNSATPQFSAFAAKFSAGRPTSFSAATQPKTQKQASNTSSQKAINEFFSAQMLGLAQKYNVPVGQSIKGQNVSSNSDLVKPQSSAPDRRASKLAAKQAAKQAAIAAAAAAATTAAPPIKQSEIKTQTNEVPRPNKIDQIRQSAEARKAFTGQNGEVSTGFIKQSGTVWGEKPIIGAQSTGIWAQAGGISSQATVVRQAGGVGGGTFGDFECDHYDSACTECNCGGGGNSCNSCGCGGGGNCNSCGGGSCGCNSCNCNCGGDFCSCGGGNCGCNSCCNNCGGDTCSNCGGNFNSNACGCCKSYYFK